MIVHGCVGLWAVGMGRTCEDTDGMIAQIRYKNDVTETCTKKETFRHSASEIMELTCQKKS